VIGVLSDAGLGVRSVKDVAGSSKSEDEIEVVVKTRLRRRKRDREVERDDYGEGGYRDGQGEKEGVDQSTCMQASIQRW
jgi:hypothetical protein